MFALRREPAVPHDGAGAAGEKADGVEEMDEAAALRMMEARGSASPQPRAMVCADDYTWWNKHAYSPSAGKPMWLTFSDASTHHVFFDDNIHNDATDSIVSCRARRHHGEPFLPLSGEATRRLQGIFLVRTPAAEAILHPRWFLEQLEACEAARVTRFGSPALQHALLNGC